MAYANWDFYNRTWRGSMTAQGVRALERPGKPGDRPGDAGPCRNRIGVHAGRAGAVLLRAGRYHAAAG